jgi:hypothetical protein
MPSPIINCADMIWYDIIGGEGSWLPVPQKCLGYDVCSVAIDAVVDEKKWDAVPFFPSLSMLATTPTPLRYNNLIDDNDEWPIEHCYGGESYFVSRVEGKLVGFKQIDEMRQLPSYVSHSMFGCAIGKQLRITVDCMSLPGTYEHVDVGDVVATI